MSAVENDPGWYQRMADRARQYREANLRAELDAQGKFTSPEECWAAHPDECRECCEPRLTDPRHGWVLWMVCDYRTCPHAHHEGEILLAS